MHEVHESVIILDSDAQETFNSLVESQGLPDICTMLTELGVNSDKLKGAVYGWALDQAGMY